MEKRNIQPQQQKPIVRPTVAKPALSGLSEEQLTAGWSGASGAILPSWCTSNDNDGSTPFFAGDDAE